MFVPKEKIAVTVDGGTNTIYIRGKMDFGTRQRVQSAIMHVTSGMDRAALRNAPLSLGEANIALLVHNILDWSGPEFAGVPCDAAHIEQLDPDEPLVDAVLAEINRRNPGKPDAADDPEGAEKNALPAPNALSNGARSSPASAKSR